MGGRCMEIIKVGMAGTLESCDASVTVEPTGARRLRGWNWPSNALTSVSPPT